MGFLVRSILNICTIVLCNIIIIIIVVVVVVVVIQMMIIIIIISQLKSFTIC